MSTETLRRYAAEREKRLRSGGREYVRVREAFAEQPADPHQPMRPREPVRDEVEFAFVGGGFAGLLTAARVRDAGLAPEDVRIIDSAGDLGGVWYWNRYPGLMCDTSSLIYMPLLEETGHRPTERYAHGPEIAAHCRRIGRQYGLYENALLHTSVTRAEWLEGESRWLVETDRGDAFRTRHLGMGMGPLSIAKLPAIPGIADFSGPWFHTSRWDYSVTGGSPEGAPLTELAGRRVAVIGTGATAIQAIPELAKSGAEVLVFQRTPTSVDVRDNGPVDPERFAELAAHPGWQARLLDNFTRVWDGHRLGEEGEVEDLIGDGWTDLGRRLRAAVRSVPPEEAGPEAYARAVAQADLAKMDEIRARVDAVVEDPVARDGLKAWYSQLCKRPGFHDEYLQSFNLPHVRLVDTDGRGVERITERGVVVGGEEHPVDVIVYATGFEYSADPSASCGFELAGSGGRTLAEAWSGGMRTLHGIHVHGFPNLFVQQLVQGAFLSSNVPHNYTHAADAIAAVLAHARATGADRVEATAEAQEEWVRMLVDNARPMNRSDCTPGYYNNEGQAAPERVRYNVGHPGGAFVFFDHLERWRRNGDFRGLGFSSPAERAAAEKPEEGAASDRAGEAPAQALAGGA
ncbi:flavin-containing monooxygenase [Brevibacterium album]|uniref:flavin-containing monooxygenase n=1 Tax=Brevibacterium album TaxID=417948 RepID=UPI00040C1AD6|nr:NAD(P)/FAD-dependent oxidoreductase [Brevibacterium album]